ncbi:phosphatase; alkaline phosphatase [Acinetobacter baumannii]|uniref:PhoX family protein n=1 Tax=Acinetobacter baumannii TaxID=470 RepID=UPI000DE608E5|nr:alkaline phosphatase PhoX [Acinetobacter baumannii]SSQ05023.1 phosphatase; alkaline phosphatase [Acinetobacter baumannii]
MTTASNHPTRRDILKWFTGIPFLPLGAMATAATLAGCNDSNNDSDVVTPPPTVNFKNATFTSMAAPSLDNPAAMATTTVASSLSINWEDGSKTDYTLAYKPFFTTGDLVADGKGGKILAGGYVDINNQPIIDKSKPGQERQFFSDCPDGSSLISFKQATGRDFTDADKQSLGVTGNPVFHVVQFEYTTRDQSLKSMYGLLPSPIAILTLDQDPKTGHLTLVKYHNVDTSKVNGLWITCGASLSPWGTHLSSEEYEPDANNVAGTFLPVFSKNLFGDSTKGNPYHYGHLPEVTVNTDGTGSIKKHYCLGRISHELVQVMPDNRTALMGDDATNGGLFMFVADKEKDLSAGTLYVAKWKQTSGVGPGAGDISWINLGHATSDEVKSWADQYKITDLMDVKTSDPKDASYTKIRYSGKDNWVKLVPGKEREAAFLETHRYAALVGASMGFTKMEGTTVNIKDKIAYSAMSYIQSSMIDKTTDIQVQGPLAGAVYAHTLKGSQVDTKGQLINSEWVSTHMEAPTGLVGEDLATADALGNRANADKIANPDNIKFSENLRTLFIGEDSAMHVNNFLWAYNVDTKVLSRILSTPAGAESTGLHAVDAVNGWTYIMSNFQHPGDWDSPVHDKVKATLDPLVRANYKDRFAAAVGYITADPIAPSVVKK